MAFRVEHLPGLSGWAPALLHDKAQSWLSLPVASGHMEFSVRLPLTPDQACAVRRDPDLAWIVFGALYGRLQSLGPRMAQDLAPDLAGAILPRVLATEDKTALCAALRAQTPDFDHVIAQASGGSFRAP